MARGGGKSPARIRYLKQRDAADYNISGPGIFITCVRGKEAKAVVDARDVFEKAAAELGVDIMATRTAAEPSKPQEDPNAAGTTADNIQVEPVEAEDDFEAQMRKELAELASEAGRAPKRRREDGDGGEQALSSRAPGPTRQQGGFRSKMTDCECLAFLTAPPQADPVYLLSYVASALQQGRAGFFPRFVLRCTPVSQTAGATVGDLTTLAKHVLAPVFGPDRTLTGGVSADGIKFRIDLSLRHHTAPLNRTNMFAVIGETIAELATPPTGPPADQRAASPPAFPPPPAPLWKHKVDIDHAELVVLATVFKNIVGMSVVRGAEYDGAGKKWNLMAIAEARDKATAAAATV